MRICVQRSLLVSSLVGITLALALPALASTRTAGGPPTTVIAPLSLAHVAAGAQAAGAQSAGAHSAAAQPLTPAAIHAAYALPDTGARAQTIAVVSAYDAPKAQADLSAYSKRYGIAPCTSGNHCFRKLNEDGKASPLPAVDPSGGQWITESALGTELGRGVCHSCSIILVEANAPDEGDLTKAINAAAAAGATVVVTSATPFEQGDSTYYASLIKARNAALVAAAGDDFAGNWGYSGRVAFPSSLPDVIAVGGTQLRLARGGGYGSEQAWSGTVSGCSNFFRAQTWQAADAIAVGCGRYRAVSDISAMSTPGAIVHVTGSGVSGGPWFVATGTSVAAPIVAGEIGLAGSVGRGEAKMLYRHAHTDPGAVHDIVKGTNAPSCSNALCKAVRGYDGPTGLGSPYGLAAFLPDGGALAPRNPQITLSAPHGLHVSRSWTTRLGLANANPFALTGTVALRGSVSVSGRRRTITFATAKLAVGPLGSAGVKLTIARGERSLLKSLRSVPVSATVRARGPAGRYVTVAGSVQLYAP
jgi:hypothetical protein